LVSHDAQAPTCLEIGWKSYETCTRCDYTTYTELPALGHTETTHTVEPTCVDEGAKVTSCTVCSIELSREILPATGHKYVHGKCTVCGDIDFLYGDVDGDGKINGKDVLRLVKYLLYMDPQTGTSSVEVSKGADANGDGKINGKDTTRLLRYLVLLDPQTGKSQITLGP